VDQRKEPRVAVRAPITVTLLGLAGEPSMPGCILNMSASGLCISVPRPIPCGVALKVENRSTLMLGEVIRCAFIEGRYEAALSISHTLTNLDDLRQLNRAVWREGLRRQAEDSGVETRSRS